MAFLGGLWAAEAAAQVNVTHRKEYLAPSKIRSAGIQMTRKNWALQH